MSVQMAAHIAIRNVQTPSDLTHVRVGRGITWTMTATRAEVTYYKYAQCCRSY